MQRQRHKQTQTQRQRQKQKQREKKSHRQLRRTVSSGTAKWHAEHQKTFRSAGLAWPPVSGPSPSNAFTDRLPERSRESLVLDEAVVPRSSFDRRFLRLGQSITRLGGRNDALPCLIPKALVWERKRRGPMFGIEQLVAQGMDLEMSLGCRAFGDNFLVDLAGPGSASVASALPSQKAEGHLGVVDVPLPTFY